MRKALNVLAVTGLFMIVITTTQYAQLGQISVLRPPPGYPSGCPAKWKNVLTIDGNVYNFNGTASANFQTATVTAANQPAGSTQTLLSLSATADAGELGTVSWTASGSSNTRIQANQLNADFPATSDIYFTPTATISSRPGVTYTGGEVHLQTSSLSSFNPQNNESYSLVGGPITFTGDDGSSFTLDLQEFVVG